VYPDCGARERLNDNAAVATIDQEIDAIYQLPPGEFTASRTALAKTLTGDAASQVRGLKKPTAVPWAVNQVYWKARSIYDRVIERGRQLRTAQIATLKGRKSDVRAAVEAHRQAVAEAVRRAVQIASEAGLNPNADQLSRMFEAVSVAATPPSDAGRFTEVVEPLGFEALSGVTPVARATTAADHAARRRKAEQERREKQEADARLNAATRELERAQERAQAARKALKEAEAAVAEAEREVAQLKAE
jgi:uncharacterized protein YecT (DUF1311 family)